MAETFPAMTELVHGTSGLLYWYINAGSQAVVFDLASEDIQESRNKIQYPGVQPDRQRKKDRRGNRSVAGPISLVCTMENIGYIWQASLGTPIASGAGPGILAATYIGDGTLDDCASGGTFSGDNLAVFYIEIDSVGGTDTFKWNQDGGTFTTTVSITGAAQTLAEGVQVTFTNLTGHALGEAWLVLAYANNYFLFKFTGTRPPVGDIERGWEDETPDRWVPYKSCWFNGVRFSVTSEWDGLADLDIIGRYEDDALAAATDLTPVLLTAPWTGDPENITIMRDYELDHDIETVDFSYSLNAASNRYPISHNGVPRDFSRGMVEIGAGIGIEHSGPDWSDLGRGFTDFSLSFLFHDDDDNGMFMWMQECSCDPMQDNINDSDNPKTFDAIAHKSDDNAPGTQLYIVLDNTLATNTFD